MREQAENVELCKNIRDFGIGAAFTGIGGSVGFFAKSFGKTLVFGNLALAIPAVQNTIKGDINAAFFNCVGCSAASVLATIFHYCLYLPNAASILLAAGILSVGAEALVASYEPRQNAYGY